MPTHEKPTLTVLVATDLSASSRHAAHRGAMLARQLGGSVDLLHVLESTLLQDVRRMLGDADADMASRIVLGKQGTGMTGELLLGNVTQQVLGQTHCDILVTPC